MKLRIKGDSLRLRLAPSEAAILAREGSVRETISFGPAPQQVLTYCLKASDSVYATRATFESNCITVAIPLAVARDWFETETVGIEASQPIDRKRSLQLLIEKDFECLDRPRSSSGEPTEEAYPNPAATSGCASGST